MIRSDDEFPKNLDRFPERGFRLSELQYIQNNDAVRAVLIPRFTSFDKIDCREKDVWDLSIGLIPTRGIEEFIVDGEEKIAVFKRNQEGWKITGVTDKEEVDTMILTHQLKSYVSIHRVFERKQFKEQHR